MNTRTNTTKSRILALVSRRPINGASRREIFNRLADENPESVARRIRELLAAGDVVEVARGNDIVLRAV